MRLAAGRGCTAAHAPARRSRPATGRRARSLQVVSLLKPANGLAVSWSQSPDDVFIKVPIADGVRGKEVSFEVHPKRLKLQVRGQPVLEGPLDDAGEIDHDASFWDIEGEEGARFVLVTLAKRVMGHQSWEQLLLSDKVDLSVTTRVVMDVSVGGRPGRLVLGLFGAAAPRTVENFRALSTGERGSSAAGTRLAFEGSPFHRIIPGFMAQGGDITLGNGMGGESIYGPSFQDENFKARHDARGCLAMANAGPNTNSSQFYITFQPTPHLDGKHVVFGKLEAGFDTLAALEEAGSPAGTPGKPVTITSCREVAADGDPDQHIEQFRAQQRAAKQQLQQDDDDSEDGPGGDGEGAAAGGAEQAQQQQQQGAAPHP